MPINVPHACESSEDATELGFGICDPISHRTTRMRIERCENIQQPTDSTSYRQPVTRMTFDANDQHHQMRWEELFSEKPRLPHSGACFC